VADAEPGISEEDQFLIVDWWWMLSLEYQRGDQLLVVDWWLILSQE